MELFGWTFIHVHMNCLGMLKNSKFLFLDNLFKLASLAIKAYVEKGKLNSAKMLCPVGVEPATSCVQL